jgi:hypothetical protein
MLMNILAIAMVLQAASPAQVTTIDTDKLKGEPTQLAWSVDGKQLFLQTSERDRLGMVRNHRYFVVSAEGGKVESVEAPPAWATEYWTWKSNQYAPGSKTFGIEIRKEERRVAATASPMGGALAKGTVSGDPSGGGTSADEVASRAAQTQLQQVIALTLKGETVGEFVNVQFLPGYTFSWAPRSPSRIAYANTSGRLAIMDESGRKQQIDGTKNVILPAWSVDGAKIAFLQKSGKNKYELFVTTVAP